MPSFKIRVPGGAQGRKSQSAQPEPSQSAPRKKRRVVAESEEEEQEEEEDEEEEEYVASHAPTTSRGRSHNKDLAQGVERLFDSDADVDVTGNANDMDRPPASPSPGASSHSQKRSARAAFGEPASRKRNKKKANVVYTDEEEEEEYYEETGKGYRDDKDDDFVVDSPPAQKKQGKKPIMSMKGKGRGAKGTKEKEIMVKDERKRVVQTASGDSGAANGKAGAVGTKRRIEALAETTSEETIAVSQSSSSSSTLATQSQTQAQDDRPPPQKRKLPTMRKIKGTASTGAGAAPATQPSQQPAKPSSGPAEAGSGLIPAFGVNLPKKPRATTLVETADIDLSSPDVYASLFKTTGASTPRAGVNTKIKEEERRKELHKMRDEARAARLAGLERSTFDLLAGQEKVARFEARLKERNSPALYPNHLASAIKYLVQSGKVPVRSV